MIRRLQGVVQVEGAVRRVMAGNTTASEVVAESVAVVDSAEVEGYRQGYVEGFEVGEFDGLQAAKDRMQALENEVAGRNDELARERERLRSVIDGMGEALERHQHEMQVVACELAMMSLSRAFGQIQSDGQLLPRLCAQVADEFRAMAVALAVSVDDRMYLADTVAGLEVVEDSLLPRGACRVLTERGQVETSIEMRLASIYRAMRENLGMESP